MNGTEQDDICTQLARVLHKVYTSGLPGAPWPGSVEYDDLIAQGRQLAHEAMYRAGFQECVSRGCSDNGSI